MNVSAIIVTRGNVDLRPVLDSLPASWEQIVWNNSGGDSGATVSVRKPDRSERTPGALSMVEVGGDWSVYGRYRAVEYASHDVIYVQDDDCVVSDPRAIVDAWLRYRDSQYDFAHPDHKVPAEWADDHVVCNQPEPWRSNPFYADHALVGFGAAFHRDAPARAFDRAILNGPQYPPDAPAHLRNMVDPSFLRTCDIVFTALTPRILVDIPHTSFDYAWGDDRMWRQPEHQSERQRMLDLVRQVPLP